MSGSGDGMDLNLNIILCNIIYKSYHYYNDLSSNLIIRNINTHSSYDLSKKEQMFIIIYIFKTV